MKPDPCPYKATVREIVDGQSVSLDLPCALDAGHKGPCSAECREQHFPRRTA